MFATTLDLSTWPSAIFALGVLTLVVLLLLALISGAQELRKAKLRGADAEELRQLVQRYEQLATTTLDAQQRTAADVSELRSRTSSIEQILRSVE
ncbi:hypothetical protein [Cellulomonas sp. URHE0023]|uniref:hypothetical protein n=1 Tax=Cellulomonas sp. URHE0023 TaxID=1380354 RepID=UPI0004858F13|nr:hypothetical protein [Cellulomonas sp. URHE0023]